MCLRADLLMLKCFSLSTGGFFGAERDSLLRRSGTRPRHLAEQPMRRAPSIGDSRRSKEIRFYCVSARNCLFYLTQVNEGKLVVRQLIRSDV